MINKKVTNPFGNFKYWNFWHEMLMSLHLDGKDQKASLHMPLLQEKKWFFFFLDAIRGFGLFLCRQILLCYRKFLWSHSLNLLLSTDFFIPFSTLFRFFAFSSDLFLNPFDFFSLLNLLHAASLGLTENL